MVRKNGVLNELLRQRVTGLLLTEEKKDAVNFAPNPGSQEKLFYEYLKLPCLENEKRKEREVKPLDVNNKWSYENQYKSILYLGGFGTGKTFAGVGFCLAMSAYYPRKRGLIVANDYPQLKRSTCRKVSEFCRFHGIELDPIAEDDEKTGDIIAHRQYCYINKVRHDVVSAQLFTDQTSNSKVSAMGSQYGWAWFDEGLFADESAFKSLITRLREPEAPNLCLITSTINWNNPFNWGYNFFADEERTDEQKRIYGLIKGTTDENFYNPDDYVEILKASRTPELFELQVRSEFVATTEGKIFGYFSRELVVENCFSEYDEIILSIDFNYSPSCAIACQKIDNKLVVIKEWYVRNCGTFKLSKMIREWLEDNYEKKVVWVQGDATGNQRTANSELTNWQIVFKELKESYVVKQLFKKVNPEIIDSINAVNNAFYFKNVMVEKNCKELIKDLESLQFDKNGKIDKKDIDRSHLADCLRYVVNHFYPIVNKSFSGLGSTIEKEYKLGLKR